MQGLKLTFLIRAQTGDQKFPLSFVTNKNVTHIKKHGMDVFMLKNSTTSTPDGYQKAAHTCASEVLFFSQITFWRYEAI